MCNPSIYVFHSTCCVKITRSCVKGLKPAEKIENGEVEPPKAPAELEVQFEFPIVNFPWNE